jgi:hypothetical protein
LHIHIKLAGNPEGKRSLGRHRLTREDNIKIDLREIGLKDVDFCLPACSLGM